MARFYLQPLHNGRWRFLIEGATKVVSKPYATEGRAGDALYSFILDMACSPASQGKYTFLAHCVRRRRAAARRNPQREHI